MVSFCKHALAIAAAAEQRRQPPQSQQQQHWRARNVSHELYDSRFTDALVQQQLEALVLPSAGGI